MPPRFSILIPARNEEKNLPGCLASIDEAAAVVAENVSGTRRVPNSEHRTEPVRDTVQVIVAVNRCTDRTEEIAREYGAVIVRHDGRNLAVIRNAAARAATGKIIVTIDADSRMSANMLAEIDRLLRSGRFIGGGVKVLPERWSLGIIVTGALLLGYMTLFRLAGGLFWCHRRDFEALGGFNEELSSVEDLDFSRRLRAYGRAQGKRFTTITRAHITTSCRKFDIFGDWYLLRHPILTLRLLRGRSQSEANAYYYDVER
jgi:glycosyltransferase involved in cell wall biosynthesis